MNKFTLILALAITAGAWAPHAVGADESRSITVFKTPWCGCCQEWTDAMEKAGYAVTTHDLEDLSQVKKQAGISADLEACHTAVIGGEAKYVLEGHVPLQAVEKLMTERPDIRGIATPGMPDGSLGMGERGDARYTVYAFGSTAGDTPAVFYQAGQ